ncbi:hypothetical protein M408DRAFT_263442 [Serendipita vermifera MAFF 305830]|uniref:Uncharacterized protein n=1 Tax=Serendipita vermifera MAFF 305830 TaxID=933852 RepID=A0A0C2X1V5_SERVB|nr:hypothetical protein M408DRAFT_263442 [Serendipita vermifera MAFF 305830]
MRFSAATVVVLATASYVLAADATKPASSTPATKADSKDKSKNKLDLSIDPSERMLKSEALSPYGSPFASPFSPYSRYGALSPLSPYSPYYKGRDAAAAMSPLSPFSPLSPLRKSQLAAKHFRKSSQKYCKGPQRKAILCSSKKSKDIIAKLLKDKTPAAAKELSTMVDMARAFMEEHGLLTALTLRKHLNYRTALTPTTPTTPKGLASKVAQVKSEKKLTRRAEGEAVSAAPSGPCDDLVGRARRRCMRRLRRKSGKKGRKGGRKGRKGRKARLAAQGDAQVPASPGPQTASATMTTQVVDPQAAAAAPASPQQASRRSLDDEMMFEKRFFGSEIEELD